MADGSSYKEVIENITRIIAEWIETAKELGLSITKPKSRVILSTILEIYRGIYIFRYYNQTSLLHLNLKIKCPMLII